VPRRTRLVRVSFGIWRRLETQSIRRPRRNVVMMEMEAIGRRSIVWLKMRLRFRAISV